MLVESVPVDWTGFRNVSDEANAEQIRYCIIGAELPSYEIECAGNKKELRKQVIPLSTI